MNKKLIKTRATSAHSKDPRAIMTADQVTNSCGRFPISMFQLTSTSEVSSLDAEPNTNYHIISTEGSSALGTITLPNFDSEYQNPEDNTIKYYVRNGDVIVLDILSGFVTVRVENSTGDVITSFTQSPVAIEGAAQRLTFIMVNEEWHKEEQGKSLIAEGSINVRNSIDSVFANIAITKMATEDIQQVSYKGELGMFWYIMDQIVTPMVDPDTGVIIYDTAGDEIPNGSNIIIIDGAISQSSAGFEWVPFTAVNTIVQTNDTVSYYKLFVPDSTVVTAVSTIKTTDLTRVPGGQILKARIVDGENILTDTEKTKINELLGIQLVLLELPNAMGVVDDTVEGFKARMISEETSGVGNFSSDGISLIASDTLAYDSINIISNANLTVTLPDDPTAANEGKHISIITFDEPCIITTEDEGLLIGLFEGKLHPNMRINCIRTEGPSKWVIVSKINLKDSGRIENRFLDNYAGAESGLVIDLLTDEDTIPSGTTRTLSKDFIFDEFEGDSINGNILSLNGFIDYTGLQKDFNHKITVTYSRLASLGDTKTITIFKKKWGTTINASGTDQFNLPYFINYPKMKITIEGKASQNIVLTLTDAQISI